MKSVGDHLAAVLAAARPVAPLDLTLADAAGCILAEDVRAPHDVPAFDVAERDGYALRAADVGARVPAQLAEVRLPVVDDAPVASPEPLRLVHGAAVLVASGSPVPRGADAVVPLERTDRGRARVLVRGGADHGECVRPAGLDVPAGEVVLRRGVRLGSRHLSVAAAAGRGRLRVHPAPRVVVVSTGDELVEPGRPRPEGCVHDAVVHALCAAVRDAGATPVPVGPVGDDRRALRQVIDDQLVRADMLVLAGGLSTGPWDTVPDVLAVLGSVRFDQVAMTPGGRHGLGTVDGVPVIALPGRPVAALVAFEVFVRPALRAIAGHAHPHRPMTRAAATVAWASPPGRRQYVPGAVAGSPVAGYRISPVGDPVRASLTSLARADALAMVAEDVTVVRPGDPLPCLTLEG